MIRASYRYAVEWIALNDEAGGDGATDQNVIAYYVTTCLIADLFGVEPLRVAGDIAKKRLAKVKEAK